MNFYATFLFVLNFSINCYFDVNSGIEIGFSQFATNFIIAALISLMLGGSFKKNN